MLSNQYTWFKNFKMVSQNFDSQNVFDFNLCSHSCKGGNVFLSVGEGWDGPPGGSRLCWSGHITHNQTQMKHGAVPVSGTPEDLSSSTRSLGWEAGLGWLKSRRYIFHHGCTHQITFITRYFIESSYYIELPRLWLFPYHCNHFLHGQGTVPMSQ